MCYSVSSKADLTPVQVTAKLICEGCRFEGPKLNHTWPDCQTWWQPTSPSLFNWSSRFSAFLWIRNFVLSWCKWLLVQLQLLDVLIQLAHVPALVYSPVLVKCKYLSYLLSFRNEGVWTCYCWVRASLYHFFLPVEGRMKSEKIHRNTLRL